LPRASNESTRNDLASSLAHWNGKRLFGVASTSVAPVMASTTSLAQQPTP
jgi:hypothetical protein